MAEELLPDSRARVKKEVMRGCAGRWEPVYCANCGKDGGLVPRDNMTFAFYLCDSCVETCGQIAGLLLLPDDVFWATVQAEQMARYGRLLSAEEWGPIVEDGSHPLRRLLEERPKGS